MSELTRLAEQHCREWQSHLRHVDELMGRSDHLTLAPGGRADLDARITPIEQAPVDVQTMSHAAAEPIHGMNGVLKSIGQQLDDVLAAVLAT